MLTEVVKEVKDREANGWTFEAADASFEKCSSAMPVPTPRFATSPLSRGASSSSKRQMGVVRSEATVKVQVGSDRTVAVGEGMDRSTRSTMHLRSALATAFPELREVRIRPTTRSASSRASGNRCGDAGARRHD